MLTGVAWGDLLGSPFLTALKAASATGLLSIKFNVDGFAQAARMGRIAGTIGPAQPGEPAHFVVGRQCMGARSGPVSQLYPVMKTIVQLGDYDSVVANKDRLQAVFSLPQDDPSYMPVTRDLSPAKRQMILNWLVTTGNSGQPNLGTPPAAPPHAAVLAAEPPGGKTAAVQRAGPSRSQRPPFVNEPL